MQFLVTFSFFKNTLEITIDFRMWIQLTFDLKGSPEGHRQKKKHLQETRKCLIFSMDQPGLEPGAFRL